MNRSTTSKRDLPIRAFKSPEAFEKWLAKNHAGSGGIWLRFYKKHSGVKSVYYPEALEIALCYGWIDALVKRFDEKSYLQRFTPRRARSGWSKRNRDHAKRLIREGRMQLAGLAQIKAARQDGRWKVAYDSPKKMKIPEDFLRQLGKNARAGKFFKTLDRMNLYAIAWRLQTARTAEIREKRMQKILQMLDSEKRLHSI